MPNCDLFHSFVIAHHFLQLGGVWLTRRLEVEKLTRALAAKLAWSNQK